jgi:hypothetical protein
VRGSTEVGISTIGRHRLCSFLNKDVLRYGKLVYKTVAVFVIYFDVQGGIPQRQILSRRKMSKEGEAAWC